MLLIVFRFGLFSWFCRWLLGWVVSFSLVLFYYIVVSALNSIASLLVMNGVRE